MQLTIRTLSPIHIGTGETLAPIEYVVYQNEYFKVPSGLLEQYLKEKDRLKAYGKWLDQEFKELKALETDKDKANKNKSRDAKDFNQRFRDKYNKINTLSYVDTLQERQNYLNFLRKTSPLRYKLSTQDYGGNKLRGQVRQAIRTADNRPYIPGSSLKGSLRTALLYYWLKNHADKVDLVDLLQDEIKKARNSKASSHKNKPSEKLKGKVAAELEVRAFYCSIEQQRNGKNKIKYDDEKMDLMKLVRFSDAHLASISKDKEFGMSDVKIYVVERKRDKRSNKMLTQSTVQLQTSYAETIPAETQLTVQLHFDIEFLLAFKDHLENKGIKSGDAIYWKGLERKVRQLFKLNLEDLNHKNYEAKRKEVETHLLNCMREFCADQLNAQQKWMENYKAHDPQKEFSEQVQAGMTTILVEKDKRLMHLGYGTGFLGTTEVLYLLQDDELRDAYKDLMELYRIGDNPKNKQEYTANPKRFPKSRRLVVQGDKAIPLGWVQLFLEKEEVKATKPADAQSSNIEPTYFKGKLNYKKPPELDAVVVKSGRINHVEVYLSAENKPVMELKGYRRPLEVGTVIIVRSEVTRRGKVNQVTYVRVKK